MHDDDLTWWHHQDELMQQLEEQERIDACNRALDELKGEEDAEEKVKNAVGSLEYSIDADADDEYSEDY